MYMYICMYVYIYVYVYICVCVASILTLRAFLREGGQQRRKKKGGKRRKRVRENGDREGGIHENMLVLGPLVCSLYKRGGAEGGGGGGRQGPGSKPYAVHPKG